jgi:LysR family glycine cleavage system transcriptional activator
MQLDDHAKPLRSLSGLIDFDCAARWGSFKLAAQELHKTPAAISVAVKQLEETVGFALFVRHPRHIELTEKGREFAATVARLLSELRAKVGSLRGGNEEKVLRISASHSFAIKWLVPRIIRFNKLYPDLETRIESNDKFVNLEAEGVDVAIRYSDVDQSDPDLLFKEKLIAVYSPDLLEPGQEELQLADLQRLPLLYEGDADIWRAFLAENSILKGKYDFARGFSHFSMMAQAAVAGQGVALVSYGIAYDDILRGTLKIIAGRSAPFQKGYRLLCNRDKAGLHKVELFRSWLIAEMEEMRQAAGI